SSRRSAYLEALTQEIKKKLTRVIISPAQTRNLLQDLFADIASSRNVILSKEEDDVISDEGDQADGPLCFFDVLA
ncbi:unnamed protein product, partial [Brassica oleracea var. botrytis]